MMEPEFTSSSVGPAPPKELVAGLRMVALRRATRAAHDRIELALPIMAADLTRERYVKILAAMHGYYVGLPLLVAGSHLARLEQDLRVLGHTAIARCSNLPVLACESALLGARYVVEGATLGGQIIRRHLAKVLHLDATTGAAFFIGYGDETRAMWARFATDVESVADFDLDIAIASAIATFETLGHWLSA